MSFTFPRITGEDFNNACIILLNVIKDSSSLDSDYCPYNSRLKGEIKSKVAEMESEFNLNRAFEENDFSGNLESTEDIWREALETLREVRADKDASSTTKLNAIKYLKEVSQDLDDLILLRSENAKIGALTELIRQFFTRLLDDKATIEPSSLAQEFLNRLKELTEDA